MTVNDSIVSIRNQVAQHRSAGRRIGFVPTMGYLHAGHLALVERARRESDVVVVSIYVNPTQFAPDEDLARYPRDPEGDRRKLEEAGCDMLFTPAHSEIYPAGYATYVDVEGITERYEGAFRPYHFRGVATVVAKLFIIVGADVAVFGRKDAQQVAVVRRMTADLHIPTRIVVVDTMREPDGLAMSSRNVYLSPEERLEALSIARALRVAHSAVRSGESLREAERCMRNEISPAIAVDYADIINADTFERADSTDVPLLAVFAGRVGRTRLIDNMPVGAHAA